jgi:hypothetical protein
VKVVRLGVVICGLLLTGCPPAVSDPPPPPRKPEIATAPPHALGALAAGTDAAPRPDSTPSPGGDAPPPVPPSEAAPDAGAPSDTGSAPKATPDAGMAL